MFFSLFSGCGGFDLGFTQAGYECAGSVDIDPDACQTLKDNFKHEIFKSDVTQNLEVVISAASRSEVLVAGPPCQGFSTAGKRLEDDPRNQLLPLVSRIALRAKPKVVVVENVAGALSGAHVKYWEELEGRLRSGGYKIANLLLHADRFGLPQRRKRAVLMAWSTNFEGPLELEAAAPKSLREILTVNFDHANHDPVWLEEGSRDFLIAAKIAPGKKLSNVRGGENTVHTWDIPEVFGYVSAKEREMLELLMTLRRKYRTRDFGEGDPVPLEVLNKEYGGGCSELLQSLVSKQYVRVREGKYDLVGTFNGKYRRLQIDGLSPTVDTRFGQPHYFLHPFEHRGFSVREAARIQGFPDSFSFSGTKTAQFRQIGNAVPPPMALSIAKFANVLCAGK